MSVVRRVGSPMRFSILISPYQRKWYRSYDKVTPLLIMTFKEKLTADRAVVRRVSSTVFKSRLVSGTVQSVGQNTATVKDASGNLITVAKVQGESYSTGQPVALFRKGLVGPTVYAI
jgi:hypothetical protein